jgi:hypothetical protein
MADITIVNGAYKPTYNWGAPSCIHKLFQIPIHLSRIYPKETCPRCPAESNEDVKISGLKQKISQRLGWKAIISGQKNRF